MDNKHLAMQKYIAQYPDAEKVFFNRNVIEDGNISLEPIFSDNTVKEYVDGSAIKNYDFAIVYVKNVSDLPNTTDNAEDIYDVEKFMDWIKEQNKSKNLPYFGENCQVLSIRNLQNMPNTSEQDERHTRYMFLCRVEYFEKSQGGI